MNELNLTNNVLHQMVTYQGRSYYTSQYFHHSYKNENGGGKYARLEDFNRLVRSIETYQDYADRGDIVELIYSKGEITNANIASLHKSNSYNPIMLISATAQVALTHHLDDEISRRVSIKINTQAATPLTTIQITLANCQALADLEMDLAKTKDQQKTQGEEIQKIKDLTKQLNNSPPGKIPTGYASTSAVIYKCSQGLSKDIVINFVFRAYEVPSKTYTAFHAEGGLIDAQCYHIEAAIMAVRNFILTLRQVTPKFCESDILPEGKRVGFILEG